MKTSWGKSLTFKALVVLVTFGIASHAHATDEPVKPSLKEECASLLTSEIPVAWVKKMIAEDKAIDPVTKRLRDSVQRVGFENLAVNQDIVREHNNRYTAEIEQGLQTNQARSGRCWIFASQNMIRSILISQKKIPADFEFSENYLHFFNILEKSNRYLEEMVRTISAKKGRKKLITKAFARDLSPEISDGGFFEYFLFLVNKYGMVPKSAMPETRSSMNTDTMNNEVRRHLASTAAELLSLAHTFLEPPAGTKRMSTAEMVAAAKQIKQNGMQSVWKILSTHLGSPPESFEYTTEAKNFELNNNGVKYTAYANKTFTPLEFAKDFVGFDTNDFVVVANYPTETENTVHTYKDSAIGVEQGEQKFNVRYLNLPSNRLEELAVNSVINGQPVWFGMNMGPDVDWNTGIMHPRLYERDPIYDMKPAEQPVEFDRDGKYLFGLSNLNHAMVITAVDWTPGKPVVKFRVENSWGEDVGDRGVFHMYREWFQQYVYQVIVHKNFLTPDELKIWEGKAQDNEISTDTQKKKRAR